MAFRAIPVAREHPGNSGSQATINATMDIAIAKDVLRNLIVASAALNINADRVESWKALLRGLPAYAVDEDGALAEWAWPGCVTIKHIGMRRTSTRCCTRSTPSSVRRADSAGLSAGSRTTATVAQGAG